MTRPALTICLGALALYLGLTVVPAFLVRAALWAWHIPYAGVPFCLVALVVFCWAAGRWMWSA